MIAFRTALVVFALAMLALGASAQSTNPMLGTWKLNVEKSKFSPGPAPKSSTVTIESAGKGIKLTSQGVAADGKATGTEYTAEYDGKDYPLKGSSVANTVSLRRISDHVAERTDKKDGKVVMTHRRELAKDGKSFTNTLQGTNSKGEPISSVTVWEKM